MSRLSLVTRLAAVAAAATLAIAPTMPANASVRAESTSAGSGFVTDGITNPVLCKLFRAC